MGHIRTPSPVLLFVAAFSSVTEALPWAKSRAESAFGPIELQAGPFPFDQFTGYYANEMGEHLPKLLWGFRNLIDPAELPAIKRKTNEWEEEFKVSLPASVARPLNLDPGYVDLGKLILASTKDHAHRIYLADGIFAETTLIYTQKQWKALPWSYPDYQSAEYQDFLTRCRNYLYRERGKMEN